MTELVKILADSILSGETILVKMRELPFVIKEINIPVVVNFQYPDGFYVKLEYVEFE